LCSRGGGETDGGGGGSVGVEGGAQAGEAAERAGGDLLGRLEEGEQEGALGVGDSVGVGEQAQAGEGGRPDGAAGRILSTGADALQGGDRDWKVQGGSTGWFNGQMKTMTWLSGTETDAFLLTISVAAATTSMASMELLRRRELRLFLSDTGLSINLFFRGFQLWISCRKKPG
jgi:hypothetical protein